MGSDLPDPFFRSSVCRWPASIKVIAGAVCCGEVGSIVAGMGDEGGLEDEMASG